MENKSEYEELYNKNWLKYLNRLSDFIFVLIRLLNQNEGLDEMLWER